MNEINISDISDKTRELSIYIKNRESADFRKDEFEKIFLCISEVLNDFTGKTYVGEKKKREVEKVFQDFFIEVKNLIMFIDSDKLEFSEEEKNFSKFGKYKGTIYRYLGDSEPNKIISRDIEYNDIFVSWSKNNYNSYFESKLYGEIKLLHCKIPDDKFGIDLDGLQQYFNESGLNYVFVKGNEREVLYPTEKENIYKIEILN